VIISFVFFPLMLFLNHAGTLHAPQYQDFFSISTIFRQVQHPMSQETQEKPQKNLWQQGF